MYSKKKYNKAEIDADVFGDEIFDGLDDVWDEVNSLDDVESDLERYRKNQQEDLPRGRGGYVTGTLYSSILNKMIDPKTGNAIE